MKKQQKIYVEFVKRALDDKMAQKMSKHEFQEALEEIRSDLSERMEALAEEIRFEDDLRGT